MKPRELAVVFNSDIAIDLFEVRQRQLRESIIGFHRQTTLDRLEIRRRYLGQVGRAFDRESALDSFQFAQADGSGRILVDGEAAFEVLAIGNGIGVALAGDADLSIACRRLAFNGGLEGLRETRLTAIAGDRRLERRQEDCQVASYDHSDGRR